MCVILQKLSMPLAPPARTFALAFNSPPVSLLPAIHLSFLSLLWITETVLWESCPNAFVLPKQSIAVSYLHTFGLLGSPGAKVTRGPAGQLVPIASRGLFFSGGRLVSLAAQM